MRKFWRDLKIFIKKIGLWIPIVNFLVIPFVVKDLVKFAQFSKELVKTDKEVLATSKARIKAEEAKDKTINDAKKEMPFFIK